MLAVSYADATRELFQAPVLRLLLKEQMISLQLVDPSLTAVKRPEAAAGQKRERNFLSQRPYSQLWRFI